MKGYLQRITSSVLGRGGPIHPIVGSMFSAPQHLEVPESFAEEEAAIPPSRPESQKPPASELPSEPSQVSRNMSRNLDSDSVRLVSNVSFRSREDSGLLSTHETLFRPLVKRSRADEIEHRAETPVTRGIIHESKMPSQQRGEQEGKAGGPYQPLLTEIIRDTAPPRIFTNRSSLTASSPVTKDRPNSTRASSVPTRESDDIQIHIGRIEVTAVQQAQTPPAAKPARKSLNLDEYLKRGSGRAS